MTWCKRRLFNVNKVISWDFIQFHYANFLQREFILEPNFRYIKRIPTPFFRLLFGHCLDVKFPFREISSFDFIYQIFLRKIWVFAFHFCGFIVCEVFDALLRFEMELHPSSLVIFINQRKSVRSKSVHVSVAVRCSSV